MSIKDEAVEAAKRIRDTAMQQTLAARIPESGHFGAIAQDADWLVDHLTAALPHMGGVKAAIQNSVLYQCTICADIYPEGSCHPSDSVWVLGDKVLCENCLGEESEGESAIRVDKIVASHEPTSEAQRGVEDAEKPEEIVTMI